MAIWTIDKEFTFEMGHRVWAQNLPHEHLSISTDCACKHLHGHSYTVKVFLAASSLDSSAMVTDFKNLNFFKKFLDETLDHKFMIDLNDPNFEIITGISANNFNHIQNFTNLNAALSEQDQVGEHHEKFILHYSSFVLVNFIPTSENMCRYLKEYAQSQIKNIASVSAVELWETKKSHARYSD